MQFQFDPDQQYQLDAISSVVSLFKGQMPHQEHFALGQRQSLLKAQEALDSTQHRVLGYGNQTILNDQQLQHNLQTIQTQNQIDSQETVQSKGRNFSIEMETGTGKTYVYLRTIFELHQAYQLTKFLIVVPSVAIREGVLKSIKIMSSHFQNLYNNLPFWHFTYQSKQTALLRHFARSNGLQMMVINIDAFNKDRNIIHLEIDQMNGIKPIEFIRATHPIVIIDEPQNMESEKSKEAIDSLNPLCTLRYSATHRDLYNPIYSLNAVQAFEKKLVKKISVACVTEDHDPTRSYIKVCWIIPMTKKTNELRCKLEFFERTLDGQKLTQRVCKPPARYRLKNDRPGDDLFLLSNHNPIYRDGFQVRVISREPGREHVEFFNGLKLSLGESQGGFKDEVIKIQIKETIKAHFQKELQLKDQGIKVLTLFFLDKVENYRVYSTGQKSQKGRYARWFEHIYNEISKEYQDQLSIVPVEKVHNGYFSKDKTTHNLKNTRGNTKDDIDTYRLIMTEKEELLNINNPLKFIFSHSALREGWDNPNIFQICTLNESSSRLKKRQEIGRGLRLPVNQEGQRIQDDQINELVVVANESYNDFVSLLQKEIEEDCGFVFGKLPSNAFTNILIQREDKEQPLSYEESKAIYKHLQDLGHISERGEIQKSFWQSVQEGSFALPQKLEDIKEEIIQVIKGHQLESHVQRHSFKTKVALNEATLLDPEFEKFWMAISKKTTYFIDLDMSALVNEVANGIASQPSIPPLKVAVQRASVQVTSKGIKPDLVKSPDYHKLPKRTTFPNILDHIHKRVHITKGNILDILKKAERWDDFLADPQKFMDRVVDEIKEAFHRLIINGVQYEKVDDSHYEMSLFKKDEHKLEFIEDEIIPTKKSVYDYIHCESRTEKDFANGLEGLQNIKYFIKLPKWFKVSTPVGGYSPDWAILKENGKVLYMIRETKSTLKTLGLRGLENYKIKSGQKHFESIKVDYRVCRDIQDAHLSS